jgi:hypothetical protein
VKKDKLDLAAATERARDRLRYSEPLFVRTRRIESGNPFVVENTYNLRKLKPWRYRLPSDTDLGLMVKAAKAGDVKAASTLLEMASGLLDSELKLPRILIGYVIYVLRDQWAVLNKKRKTNFNRDYVIACTIAELQHLGYNPTRNREEKQRESGCSIVAKVLAERSLKLPETAVEKIWQRFSKYPRYK